MTRDANLAARVPLDVRTAVEARVADLRRNGVHYPDGREVDLSYVVRRALRRELDLPVAPLLVGPDLGPLDHAPRSHTGDPSTSRQAAAAAWPRANTQRRKALELIAQADPRPPRGYAALTRVGTTGDELDTALGGYNGRRRLSELKVGGWVEALIVDGQPVHRNTRNGSPAVVYVLTAAARHALDEEARLAA